MWNPPSDCPVKSYLEKVCWVRGLATRILLYGGTDYTKEPTDHPPVANTSAVARYRDNWSVWFLSLSYANRRCVETRPSWDVGLSHLDLEWPSGRLMFEWEHLWGVPHVACSLHQQHHSCTQLILAYQSKFREAGCGHYYLFIQECIAIGTGEVVHWVKHMAMQA